ncbi:carbohydrate kinase [Terrimonas sp.]|uniref:FGGY-family carbohydrate kinase n=1 Tax=Terrimonas sp. TaxID=1914338 RepID=UPI000D5255BC|nr:FGGY family carbohydrate kinase [Terrimonas sp.]PVD49932.1 carbohydrate kinase [Terrimonas sp.]
MIPVIAIYDIGKTNKKVFLFNEDYEIVYEKSTNLTEIQDDDGDMCEDVQALTNWVKQSFEEIQQLKEFDIVAVNVTAYGASLVHIDEKGKPVAPLYNYLKPYPEDLQKAFYEKYGGVVKVSQHTASPVLGSLNSGMLLYNISKSKPEVFKKIKYSLHLPQYISSLLNGMFSSDITSIGCHTMLWDFTTMQYHEWVTKEGIADKLAPIQSADDAIDIAIQKGTVKMGIGLHDSSAALIPYLLNFKEPFILLSTGTWAISLNPFNDTPLTEEQLKQDCLCYLTYKKQPVKASRLFAGYEHEQQVKLLATHFNKPANYYTTVKFDNSIIDRLTNDQSGFNLSDGQITAFPSRDINLFSNYEHAYHQLIADIIYKQVISTKLVLEGSREVKRIFVDGGFGKNPVYMHLLADAFPNIEVYAASVAQATSMGTALSIHEHWNTKELPASIIDLMYYHSNK